MVDSNEPTTETTPPKPVRRRAAVRPAGPPAELVAEAPAAPAKKAAAKTTAAKKTVAKKVAKAETEEAPEKKPVKKAAAKKTTKKASDESSETPAPTGDAAGPEAAEKPASRRRPTRKKADAPQDGESAESSGDQGEGSGSEESGESSGEGGPSRRRRRRGGRGRRRGEPANTDGSTEAGADSAEGEEGDEDGEDDSEDSPSGSSRRRRRRRRRGSEGAEGSSDDPPGTVVKVREPRDSVSGLKGSTRLEAKRQRRREGRDHGRRRAPILTEAEFLARREDVERVMVVRQTGTRTQIAVLEDGVLVEHYVDRDAGASMVGNIYLGRVQNVLPSMEAAFVDVGRGRNAVLYAGEVNWDAAGLDGQPRRIELAMKSGDTILVQVTKDPVGQKGSRLTSQISLPGRFVVFVPNGEITGISRKLPEGERNRLKAILKRVVPDGAGVIVRTAAEGASEQDIVQDVEALQAQWVKVQAQVESGNAPALLHGEPDLAIKVARDIFNEDVNKLIVAGSTAADQIRDYVASVAPELLDRVQTWVESTDVFASYRIDEQLTKALDRKVWLPSGGSLVIDRTEAMTVVDVNTGKFTGQGGNLEETVTRNNIEAAEEIVRQLRLRDIGGIIVVDFIDMVLESNRDLVLRRLVECLGRDRTKHQVAEVTSLGLVQMTRKRIGQGLLESFSTSCESCGGRGHHVSLTLGEGERKKPTGVDPAEVAARSILSFDPVEG
ncbi:MAG: Rne/Rng family ribonuclease [Actinobacteria bacterium]|nr:Rne/Rng family ribonuclease [Actinomycetota bacterium]